MTGLIKTKRTLLPSGEWKLEDIYTIDGKPVTKKQWRKAFPEKSGHGVTLDGTSTYPHMSMGAGVHPRQAGAAMEYAKKAGVPTEFTSEGKAVFTSREHRRKYLAVIGAHDNNAFGRV